MNTADDQQEAQQLEQRIQQSALPATLGDFVHDNAQRYGDLVALNYFQDARTVSYTDLDETADRLACGLSTLGVRKGAHVCVMLPNVAETFITWTAIGRTGAVMVPANIAYTASELSFLLNDADVQFMIVHEECLLTVLATERPVMLADANLIVVGATPDGMTSWQALVDNGHTPFIAPTPVHASDLLNIQYTSGTTGFPKGCMLTHEYWMHTGFSLGGSWQDTRGDDSGVQRTLVWPPFFYMDGMWQALGTFLHGATAYVPRRMSMSDFVGWLVEHRIQCCTFPEPVLKKHPASSLDEQLALKYIYSFGWHPESKQQAEQRFNCHALDAYGMTELGTATITPRSAGEKSYQTTCGVAAPNRTLKIADENGDEVACGERGELWVKGRGIMWGYYKRPAANAEVFRGEWFRTGDIFYRDEHGYHFIVGRMKDMVKRAGENIAAREVEAVLHQLDGVSEAAIIAVPDPVRREEVKACIKLAEGWSPGDLPPQAILDHCAKHLARFKIPRYIAYVDEFPRTPTRKVAKNRLIAESEDLRVGAFDSREEIWR